MHDFQKKKRIRKIMYSPITLTILALVFAVLVSGVWGVYNKMKLSLKNLDKEKTEQAKLEHRKVNLATSIEYLKTEQGIENEIRTKFRAVKDGEKIAVIVEDKESTTTQMGTTTPNKSLLYRIFHWPQ